MDTENTVYPNAHGHFKVLATVFVWNIVCYVELFKKSFDIQLNRIKSVKIQHSE